MAKVKHSLRPPIRVVDYGPQGTGKSWLAASFGRGYLEGHIGGPLLVLMTDPRGKEAAYLDPLVYRVKRGEVLYETGTEILGQDSKGNDLVVPFTNVSIRDQLITRIEFLHEESLEFDEDKPDVVTGWTVLPKVRKRLNRLFREEMDYWGTVSLDSMTSLELMIRSYHQYVQNPGARGEARKQWWGEATSELERILCIRFASWRQNLVVICHTDKDKAAEEAGGGVLRYNPKLPGRLSGDLSSYYAEVYHSIAETSDEGETSYMIQTRPSSMFTAFSNFCKAPNPCENDYDALWTEQS